MPRIARIIAAGYPHHITQRGNNRATVFFDDEDRQTYLNLLSRYANRYHISIWAYCLMGNHIHLLAVPETEIALSRGIGLTNLMYTQHLNRKLKQSGRIWQNRFSSCVVENDQYLWSVARYIERNPLKVALARSAELYRWSSAKAHIIGTNDPLLDATPWLSPQARSAYAEFVRDEDKETDNAIRRATRTGPTIWNGSIYRSAGISNKSAIKAKKTGEATKNWEVPLVFLSFSQRHFTA